MKTATNQRAKVFYSFLCSERRGFGTFTSSMLEKSASYDLANLNQLVGAVLGEVQARPSVRRRCIGNYCVIEDNVEIRNYISIEWSMEKHADRVPSRSSTFCQTFFPSPTIPACPRSSEAAMRGGSTVVCGFWMPDSTSGPIATP